MITIWINRSMSILSWTHCKPRDFLSNIRSRFTLSGMIIRSTFLIYFWLKGKPFKTFLLHMKTTVAILTNYFCFVFMLFRMKNDLGGEENTLPPNLVISVSWIKRTTLRKEWYRCLFLRLRYSPNFVETLDWKWGVFVSRLLNQLF